MMKTKTLPNLLPLAADSLGYPLLVQTIVLRGTYHNARRVKGSRELRNSCSGSVRAGIRGLDQRHYQIHYHLRRDPVHKVGNTAGISFTI